MRSKMYQLAKNLIYYSNLQLVHKPWQEGKVLSSCSGFYLYWAQWKQLYFVSEKKLMSLKKYVFAAFKLLRHRYFRWNTISSIMPLWLWETIEDVNVYVLKLVSFAVAWQVCFDWQARCVLLSNLCCDVRDKQNSLYLLAQSQSQQWSFVGSSTVGTGAET